MCDRSNPILVRCGVKVYSVLLHFYPKRLRRDFGTELLAVFGQQSCDAYHSRGLAGLSVVWMQVVLEAPSTVLVGELQWQMFLGVGLAIAISLPEFWLVTAATGVAKIGVL